MSTNEVSSNPNASAICSPNQCKFAKLRKFASEPVPEVYGGDNRRIISYTHVYTKAYGKDSRPPLHRRGVEIKLNHNRFFLTVACTL
jgi:hypothetical protein